MHVQSIKQISQNTNPYSSNINEQIPSPFDKGGRYKDEFVPLNKKINKISFGASIEYYARKFFHDAAFGSICEDIFDNEYDWFARNIYRTDANINAVERKARSVLDKIKEMKNAAEAEERRKQKVIDDLESTRRWQRAESERMEGQRRELEKKLQLDKLEKKKEALKVEREKLQIEEQQLELDRKKLIDEKLSIYTEPIKSAFVSRAQVEKNHPEQKIGAFPNGILLIGFDKKTANELVQWTVENSDCELKTIDFSKLDAETVLPKLLDTTKEMQQSDRRTVLRISNFDRFTMNSPENQNIIPKLKAFLSACAEKYKCTVITEVEDSSALAPEIIAAQRFQVKIKPE